MATVRRAGSKPPFDRCNIFDLELEPTRAHDGRGHILSKRFLTAQQIAGSCNFMDVSVVPPGVSIGDHTHATTEEEYYLILKGSGIMHRDGETFEARAGDLIRNRPGGSHSLLNDGSEDILMFVFELGVDQ